MRFSSIIALTLFYGALGAPAPIVPRQDANSSVWLCNGNDFQDCAQIPNVPKNTCVNVPDSYNDKISSFQPSQGLKCMLYSDKDCKGSNPGGFIVSPGSKDMSKYNFNDMTSSFICADA
ncbi:hypothetical protein FRC12_021521 [Ceratobasidium sp. 428]|nr:hypothetical protein FRC12_021521 [Ceratobasidium sp. 428]